MKLVITFATLWISSLAGKEGGAAVNPETTPVYLILGKTNGQIWRCAFDAPTTCELFHDGSSTRCPVTHTLLHGEHLYVSHDNGVILKCEWYEKNKCELIYRGSNFMNSLTIADGYLFAGGDDKDLVRCELNPPHNCKAVVSFDQRITGLYEFDKNIYVLIDDYISRCPKADKVNCILIATTGEKWVKAISGWKSTTFAVGYTCTVWTYNSTSFISYKYLENSESTPESPWCIHMAIFKGNMYILQKADLGIIDKCKLDGKNSCENFVVHKGTRSISFVYSARHLRKEYLKQDNDCHLQPQPSVVYKYRAEHRALMEAQVRDGKLCDAQGMVVDTRAADEGYSGRVAVFAMGPGGQLLLTTSHRSGLIHITSFFADLPVAGAGEMVVEDGVVKKIVACSDHYRTDVELNQQVVHALYAKGYTREIQLEPCSCGRD